MIQMNLLTKQKQTPRLREQTCGCQEMKEGWREGTVEFGMDMCTLLYLKWITMDNKHVLYSIGNCSVLCGSLDERGFGGEWIHVYVWLSPFTVHLKLSQHC